MSQPVVCAFCGRVYDLGKVEPFARYADCSVWLTPCCNRQADDRGETGWKTVSDYRPLPQSALLQLGDGRVSYFDSYGNVHISR